MNNEQIQLPPVLKPGDLLKVVGTSGTLRESEAFEKGVEIWRSRGYRIEFTPGWNARCGYLAGSDTERRQALSDAWQDPNCKGILCTRGGYGSTRLLEDWNGFQEGNLIANPKWIIGFSDVTALLWNLFQAGVSGVHAPVLTTLAQEPSWSIERLFNWVEHHTLEPLTGKGWSGGSVEGILLPGNLTVATCLLGTTLLPSLEGVILALEEVTEAPYRVDRLLTQWRMSGELKRVKGIALGRFSRCEAPSGIPSWSIEEVLRDRFQDLNIPIVGDLPFGHDGVNAALPVGKKVNLDGDQGTLTLCSDSC